jgi:hypothetical protein
MLRVWPPQLQKENVMTKKNTLSLTTLVLNTLVLTIVLAASLSASAQSEKSGSSKGLGGTWHVQVTLQNCATHASLGSFESILSFHQGGTMSGTTTNPAFAPGQRTSDYGVWSYSGDHTYSATSEAFLLFSAGPFPKGTQRLVQAIKVDGNEFNSVATVQFFDVNHVQVISGCAVATGTRFE